MKFLKNKITGITIVLIVILVALSPWIIWHFKPDRHLDVLVFDKTVPQNNYREHKGFIWLLNSFKYTKLNGDKYGLLDYFGFFPEPNYKYKIKPLPKDLSKYDLLYVTDTYGVYDRDFYGTSKNIEGERSQKIYGGTQSSEISSIKSALENSNKSKTLIVEFNSLASPTDTKVQKEMDQLLGLKWSGWIGREFKTLNKNNEEIPRWVFRNYRKQYGKEWNFTGSGYVFVKNDDTLMILEKRKDTTKDMTFKFSPKGQEDFGIKREVGYYYWFDIMEKVNNTESIADYTFFLTESGKDKFKKFGIPTSFPAITESKIKNHITYYFSGDYADKGEFPVVYQAVGLPKINSLLISDYGNTDSFFWKIYAPVMQKILDNTYEKKSSETKTASIN
ncbi:MAG: hypothetical protein EOP00_33375 [Pedobacter sp.]|nr:MAG: hypothetical protein EOP00_33375 [Pedobacter sp.]